MRADAIAKRRRLVAAAKRQFAENGAQGPLTSVAQAAGVGIGTLYRHFPTRSDLVYALAEDLCSQAVEATHTCLRTWDANPESAWHTLVRELAAMQVSVLVTQLADPAVLQSLPAESGQLRELALVALDAVLVKAKAVALVTSDLTSTRLLIGITAISRPQPPLPPELVPDETDWLVGIFLRGLLP